MSRTPARLNRRTTIVDVAARAGVSRQTVSRAMNDLPGISAGTRARVLEAADELGYRPSRSGRALAQTEPPVLGLLVADLTNAFFSELATEIIREAARHGWSVVLSEDRRDESLPGGRGAVIRQLGERVDALVGYAPLGREAPGNAAVPVVLLDSPEDADPAAGRIAMDPEPALEDLVAHLRTVGARAPAVLDSRSNIPVGATTRSQRAWLLQQTLEKLGGGEVPVALVEDDGEAEQAEVSRVEVIRRLVEAPPQGVPPRDVLVAYNDKLAVQLLRTLRSRGIEVPGTVRVVGHDGLELGTLVTPTLTTLASDAREIARHAVELAVGIYERSIPSGPRTLRHHHYTLVLRESA